MPLHSVVVEAASTFLCAPRVRLPPASTGCCDSPLVGPCIPPGSLAPRGARSRPPRRRQARGRPAVECARRCIRRSTSPANERSRTLTMALPRPAGRAAPARSRPGTDRAGKVLAAADPLLVLVGWVAVFAQYALDQPAQVGADVFAKHPVDPDVVPRGLDQLPTVCSSISAKERAWTTFFRRRMVNSPFSSFCNSSTARLG